MFKIKPIFSKVLYVQVNIYKDQKTQDERFNMFVIGEDLECLFILNNKPHSIEFYDLVMQQLNLDFIYPDSSNSVIFIQVAKVNHLRYQSNPEVKQFLKGEVLC